MYIHLLWSELELYLRICRKIKAGSTDLRSILSIYLLIIRVSPLLVGAAAAAAVAYSKHSSSSHKASTSSSSSTPGSKPSSSRGDHRAASKGDGDHRGGSRGGERTAHHRTKDYTSGGTAGLSNGGILSPAYNHHPILPPEASYGLEPGEVKVRANAGVNMLLLVG